MRELLFYNTNVVTDTAHLHLPGVSAFKKFFSIYPRSSVFIDRTESVKIPVHVKSLFPIPKLRPFSESFEEICDERAKELLERAEQLDVRLYVFWSGGIDSTLVLVSLLKNATSAQRARIAVLLTEESIAENPNFFADHLRGGVTCESATLFPYILGTEHMMTTGDHNDQIFGSDVCASLMGKYGFGFLHENYNRDKLFDFFNISVTDEKVTNLCLNLIERICSKAPVTLKTNYDHLWWLNFSVKWQYVNIRILAYTAARNAHNVNEAYVSTRFDQFFNTEKFQLWSMQNMDKKIKDSWSTYKWVCKDIIFDYTKDEQYRANKTKRGSLSPLIQQQQSFNFIDSKFTLHRELDVSEYYQEDNDFA